MNMKRLLSILIALTIGLAAKAQTEIGTKEQLIAFATSVNDGTFGTGSANLTADIDLDGVTWTPIGTSEHPFRGKFYGNDHKISNLTVNTSGLYAGLFGYVDKGAEVTEVHVMSGTIAVATDPGVKASYHGGIAGYNLGAINKCSNRATVSGSGYEHARIGGIVGENGTDQGYSGVTRNCYNLGDVYSSLTNVYIGGIVGYNYGSVYNSFMRSTVRTNVSNDAPYPLYGNNAGTVSGCFYAGGATSDVSLPIDLADNADNNTTLTTNNGQTKNVLLSGRTLFTDGGWNTLCLPFSIPKTVGHYSPIAGATVMTLSNSSFSEGVLTLTFDYANSIEAGKPYIVKWNTDLGNISNPVFMGVTVSNTTTNTETAYVDFVGTYAPIVWETENKSILFLGTSNKLYYPQPDLNDANTPKYPRLNACRAHFQLKGIEASPTPSQGGANSVKAFKLNFGDADSETGLTPALSKGKGDGAIYDLSGRKVANGQRPIANGIYIKNGKKIFVK